MSTVKTRIGLKLLYVTAIVGILYGIEQFWVTSFGLKVIYKVLLLFLIPLVLGYMHKDRITTLFSWKHTDKKRLKTALWLGGGVFTTIIAAYVLLVPYIDIQSILLKLNENAGVGAHNFWYIGLYLILGNSLAEEYFFRAYLILQEKSKAVQKYMHYVSAAIFAVYHVTILIGWFNWFVFLIVFAGLFAGGLFFSWLNKKGESIYNGWIMHMGADIGIVVIGFWLFYGPK